jgi:hypothetical protein
LTAVSGGATKRQNEPVPLRFQEELPMFSAALVSPGSQDVTRHPTRLANEDEDLELDDDDLEEDWLDDFEEDELDDEDWDEDELDEDELEEWEEEFAEDPDEDRHGPRRPPTEW